MVFIKKDEIISTNDFIVYKRNDESLKKYSIDIFVIKQNRDYILAKFDNELEQETLYKKIISAISNHSPWVII